MEKTFKKIVPLACALWLGVFIFDVKASQAATLYLSPSSGNYAVGANFTVNVYLSSADEALNAASGVVAFPSDKLEVVSVSKAGSVITLWVQEPTFSNTSGNVTFEGIALNPGYTGSSGKAISITFKAKAAGTASVTFSSGSILANDGLGTNILSGFGKAEFTLGVAPAPTPTPQAKPSTPAPAPTPQSPAPAPVPSQAPPVPSSQAPAPEKKGPVPAAPVISSPSHPEPEKWYSNKNATFNWLLPNDMAAVALSISQSPSMVPEISYVPPIYSKTITDLADGVWHFSARFKNNHGWGEIGRFEIQIDTKPPETFAINFLDGKSTHNPNLKISVNPKDALSGMTGVYEIKVDSGNWFSASGETIALPTLTPGKHKISVKATDMAGNSTVASDGFEIFTLSTPTINYLPRTINRDELLTVRGTTYPSSTVMLWIQRKGDKMMSYTLMSDAVGKFEYVSKESSKPGTYSLWTVVNNKGVNSKVSAIKTFKVSTLTRKRAVNYAWPLLLVGCLYAFRRFRRRLVGKTCQVKTSKNVPTTPSPFENDVREQVRLLARTKSRRELTPTEERLLKKMKKHLEEADEMER